MISSKQWDAIMAFTGYGSTTRATNTYTTKPDLSGSAYKDTTDTYDVSKNIYDLAGNVYEFTLKANNTYNRTGRGGSCVSSYSASDSLNYYPSSSNAGARF